MRIKLPFGMSPDQKPDSITYRHTTEYRQYMSDPVSAEKRILTARGLDEFNVGHTTRSREIRRLIEDEFRSAEVQLHDHLHVYRNRFIDTLSNLAKKKSEMDQLAKDLESLDKHIKNLEFVLKKEVLSNE